MAAAAQQRAGGTPFFWRVASGVMYAEMPLSRSIRPPLLSDWESDRVQAFRNRERRSPWLAGRALAKVLVKERLGLQGIVEIREGADGEPLVYQNGFPMPDVWLGISVRHGRVSCVLADRPVSLEVRNVKPAEAELVDGFSGRGEQRTLRRLLGSAHAAQSAAWAIKEAAQRAARIRAGRSSVDLRSVRIDFLARRAGRRRRRHGRAGAAIRRQRCRGGGRTIPARGATNGPDRARPAAGGGADPAPAGGARTIDGASASDHRGAPAMAAAARRGRLSVRDRIGRSGHTAAASATVIAGTCAVSRRNRD